MGMFDDVIFEAPCFKCGEIVKGFQSKSGHNMLAQLTPKQLYKVAKANRCIHHGRDVYQRISQPTFYSSCDNCGTWNEYTFKTRLLLPPKIVRLESDKLNGKEKL